jgi:integrase
MLPISPETLCDYLTHLAESGIKTAGLDSARWAIDQIHRFKELERPSNSEQVRLHLKGLKRLMLEQRPEQVRINRKQPITIDHIRKMHFQEGIIGIRDKALLLTGFATGMRRSELAAMKKDDIQSTEFGYRITIWKSKTNQEGLEEKVDLLKATRGKNLDWCPVNALEELLEAVPGDAVFQSMNGKGVSVRFSGKHLSGYSIACIVKKVSNSTDSDTSQFAGHSLRAGCATYLLDKEVSPAAVQKQMRHKSFDTTQQYNRGETARALRGAY